MMSALEGGHRKAGVVVDLNADKAKGKIMSERFRNMVMQRNFLRVHHPTYQPNTCTSSVEGGGRNNAFIQPTVGRETPHALFVTKELNAAKEEEAGTPTRREALNQGRV